MNQKIPDAGMKTLVKYVPKDRIMSVRCKPFKSRVITAGRLVAEGFGDHTVQEDGRTVHITQAEYVRI